MFLRFSWSVFLLQQLSEGFKLNQVTIVHSCVYHNLYFKINILWFMAHRAVIVQVMWNAWKAKCNMWSPFPKEFKRMWMRMSKMVEEIKKVLLLYSLRFRRRKGWKIHINWINVYLYNCALYSMQKSNNLTEEGVGESESGIKFRIR